MPPQPCVSSNQRSAVAFVRWRSASVLTSSSDHAPACVRRSQAFSSCAAPGTSSNRRRPSPPRRRPPDTATQGGCTSAFTLHYREDICGQRSSISVAGTRESPDRARVVVDRRGRQPTIPLQVGSVFLQNLVELGCLGRRQRLVRDDAIRLQPGPDIVQCKAFVPRLRAMASGGVTEESFLVLCTDVARRPPLPAKPPAEVADDERLLPVGDLRISAASEIFRIRLEVRSQRPFNIEPRRPLSARSVHRPQHRRPPPVAQDYADKLGPIYEQSQ